jgi:hypothetical protein
LDGSIPAIAGPTLSYYYMLRGLLEGLRFEVLGLTVFCYEFTVKRFPEAGGFFMFEIEQGMTVDETGFTAFIGDVSTLGKSFLFRTENFPTAFPLLSLLSDTVSEILL